MHVLDADLSEYTRDIADDVNRYMRFLKTFPEQLHRQGASVSGTERVDASRVATLKGSTVDSVNKSTIGKRLTNLLAFNVDIRRWEHYCSTETPDLGGTCAQAGTALSRPIERFPAISRNTADLASSAAPRQRPRLSSKRSLTLRASNWVLSVPAASVSTPRWRRRSMTQWCCALELGETRGFMKAIVDADSHQILGCAILGVEGVELMAIIQVAMLGKLPYAALQDAIFTHPTLAKELNALFTTIDA